MKEELGPLTPELILAVSAVAGLLAGSWLPRGRQWAVRLLAASVVIGIAPRFLLDIIEPAARTLTALVAR